MSTRAPKNAPLRFARTLDSAFKTPGYAAAVERPMPRSMLLSPSFWIGGALSLAVWTGFYFWVTA